MKRKFLAKAITLGLMLAVPFGVEAAEIITADGSYTYNTDKEITVNTNPNNKYNITIVTENNKLNFIPLAGQVNHGLKAENKANSVINIRAKNISFAGDKNQKNTDGILVKGGNKVIVEATGEINVSGTGQVVEVVDNNAELYLGSNDTELVHIENASPISSNSSRSMKIDNGGKLVLLGRRIQIDGNTYLAGMSHLYFGTDQDKAGIIDIRSSNITVATGAELKVNSTEFNVKNLGISSAAKETNITIKSDSTNIGHLDTNRGSTTITGDNVTIGGEGNQGEAIHLKGFDGKIGRLTIDSKNITINGDIDTTDRNGGIVNINQNQTDAEQVVINGNIKTGFDKANDKDNSTTGEGSLNTNNSQININLSGAKSALNGNVIDYNQSSDYTGVNKDSGTNISLSNGATWTTTGDSTVKEVKSNGGVINLAGNDQNVNINNLTNGSGSGETPDATTIKTDSINNKLNIGSNENKLEVEASSKVTDSMGNDIQGGMKKLLNNINVENGTKETTVTAAAGSVTGETTITRDADGNSSAAKEEVHKENAGISEMASIALMAWRAENNDMNKRLGELRDSKGEHGVWTRMVRGQSKYGAQNVKNQYSTYQLGYDEKLSVDKHWTVGAAVSYTNASSSFSTGHGENKSTGFAVYGSYLSDNGSFVDLIAKAARLKNEFDVLGGAGKGDYKTNGYSLSAEYGKRFTKDNGFWIEPQVELTYGYVGAVDYLTNNDVKVRQNGMDSLVGRIGFSMGRNIKAGNVYARASYLYEFDGETDVTFSNKVTRGFKQDLGGGWWEVGVGTNINLSDATHLYFDVEKTYGGNVATPWQWNAGVRWSF